MSVDADEIRRRSEEQWEAAASGWARRQATMRDFTAPLAHAMIAAIDPQPGQRVLELAAGIGETGFLAAELVAPGGGRLISSDQSQNMVDAARERAAELGLANVEFKVLGAEWIDLPVASVDAIICRFGFMLMADPEAALLESRRVLVSGGRIALAVWDIAERNPWIDIARRLLADRGLGETPAPGTPGPFVLADPERLGDLVAGAGFEDVDVQAVDLVQSTASFDDYWETQLDISPGIHATVMDQPAAEIAEIKSELRERMAPFTKPDGSLALPGRALLAAAGA